MTKSATNIRLNIDGSRTPRTIEVSIGQLIIAGWTGRDAAAMEAHIVELEKLGVPRPKSTPIFYRGSHSLLTQACGIEVVGEHSSGEVEPIIFSASGDLWLGLGSDHTDRKIETIGITVSKQLCAKPVAENIWQFKEVSDHWDNLIVRSWATRNGQRTLYQEGALSKMRHPLDLMKLYGGPNFTLPEGTAMFCGTLAVHGEIAPAELLELELEDPILKRKIIHHYHTSLPIAG